MGYVNYTKECNIFLKSNSSLQATSFFLILNTRTKYVQHIRYVTGRFLARNGFPSYDISGDLLTSQFTLTTQRIPCNLQQGKELNIDFSEKPTTSIFVAK
jgi:hypothetical protein